MEKQAIYRYLGGAASEPQLDEMIARAEAEVKRAAAPRYVDGRFPLSVAAEGVTIGGTYLASKTLASHLRGCQEAFLTAFTLGPGIDALIKRYELMEMPLVPVLQACAAAYTEEQADLAQGGIAQYTPDPLSLPPCRLLSPLLPSLSQPRARLSPPSTVSVATAHASPP